VKSANTRAFVEPTSSDSSMGSVEVKAEEVMVIRG
jgi:hypothetical protein